MNGRKTRSGLGVLTLLAVVGCSAPGQCATVAISGKTSLPANGTPEGAFYLGAVVDPGGAVAEIIEDNNARAGDRMGLGGRADFVITALTGPSSYTANTTAPATFTLCNQGPAYDTVDVELYFSQDAIIRPRGTSAYPEDFIVGRLTGVTLAGGTCSTQTITLRGSVPTAGTYYLGAVADPANARPELIEDNNALAGPLTAVSL